MAANQTGSSSRSCYMTDRNVVRKARYMFSVSFRSTKGILTTFNIDRHRKQHNGFVGRHVVSIVVVKLPFIELSDS